MGQRRFTKADIDTHSDRMYDKAVPAVNVKVYRYNWDADKIADTFGCDTPTAEQAGQYAWDCACELFWEQAQEIAQDIFGAGAKVYSQGRSGGWLVVDGIDTDIESWDAIAVSRWGRLVKWCKAEIAYRMDWEQIKDDIEANQWVKPGSEQYNFIDKGNGETVCIADLKAQAVAAGFAPVVRK